MNGQRPARCDLLLIFLFRTVLNSGYRMMYPFLPAFSRGLGVDLKTMSLALSVRAAALAALAVVLFAGTANELVNVAFGRWLEDSFGLKLAALGLASALIGVCEFAGEGLVALTTDRVGKSKAVGFGLAACAVVSLLLPLGGRSAVTAVAGLALFYFAFEYMVVSLMPLVSEILPGARATLMAFYAAAVSVGRAFGSWLSPRLYEAGFMSVTAAAAALYAAAFLMLFRLRRLSGGRY